MNTKVLVSAILFIIVTEETATVKCEVNRQATRHLGLQMETLLLTSLGPSFSAPLEHSRSLTATFRPEPHLYTLALYVQHAASPLIS
jgi:hypothetical protein